MSFLRLRSLRSLPGSKLVYLAIRQFAKYLTDFMKEKAKEKPLFRKYICIPPAQLYHWCEVRMKMSAMNIAQPVKIKPLSEEHAISLGSHLMGEFVLFFILAGAIMFEITRQSRKESKKKIAEQQYDLALTETLIEMNDIMDVQYNLIMNMKKALEYLDQSAHDVLYVKPSEPLPKFREKKSQASQATIEMKTKQMQTDEIQ